MCMHVHCTVYVPISFFHLSFCACAILENTVWFTRPFSHTFYIATGSFAVCGSEGCCPEGSLSWLSCGDQ